MICDKCSTEVSPDNDAGILDVYMSGRPEALIAAGARHLLPVVVDGEQICEGSPSRAQYLEGQPRDSRYPYHAAEEAAYRAAYAKMRAVA